MAATAMNVNVKVHLPTFPFFGTRKRMTIKQFKAWLESMDVNKDGIITTEELEWALRRLGLWFPGWRSSWAVYLTDTNCNGVIDSEEEKKALMEYAQLHWGIIICDE